MASRVHRHLYWQSVLGSQMSSRYEKIKESLLSDTPRY